MLQKLNFVLLKKQIDAKELITCDEAIWLRLQVFCFKQLLVDFGIAAADGDISSRNADLIFSKAFNLTYRYNVRAVYT